jgi:hypothetical protein
MEIGNDQILMFCTYDHSLWTAYSSIALINFASVDSFFKLTVKTISCFSLGPGFIFSILLFWLQYYEFYQSSLQYTVLSKSPKA